MTSRTRDLTGTRNLMANGYVRVKVNTNDWRYEHRLVWEAANGPIPDGCHVHHINHDRTDNRLENLELLPGREHNLDDAEIVRRRATGESFRSIGRAMGAAHNVISNHYRRALERQKEQQP